MDRRALPEASPSLSTKARLGFARAAFSFVRPFQPVASERDVGEALVRTVDDLLETLLDDEGRQGDARDRLASGVGQVGQAEGGPGGASGLLPRLGPRSRGVEGGARALHAVGEQSGLPVGRGGRGFGLAGRRGQLVRVRLLLSREVGDSGRGEIAGDVAQFPFVGFHG